MYLIVGAHGFLGSYLIREIQKRSEEKIVAVSRRVPHASDGNVAWIRCDIGREAELFSLKQQVEGRDLKVIFLAAYHNPDLILRNPNIAWRINVTALAMFLEIFDAFEAFYYASTEVVYGDGGSDALAEDSPRRPVSRYGQLKALAEDIVLAAGGNVVRFPVLMGPSLLSDKKHFYDHIVDTLKAGKTIEMFSDQRRSILDFGTAASCLLDLMENKDARKERLVNISGDEPLSKYDVGLRIAEKYALDTSLVVPAVMEASGVFTEHRAKETILDNSLLKRMLHRETVTMVI